MKRRTIKLLGLFAVLMASVSVFTARAELLLYDGFATETDAQNRAAYSTGNCSLQSGNAQSVAWTTGLSASKPWSESSGGVYTFSDNGLTLPAAFTKETGDQFTARGGSAGWLGSSTSTDKRAKNRAIDSTMPTSGTLWYRCVMLMEQGAYNMLKNSKANRYFGTGLSTAAAANSSSNGATLADKGFRIYFAIGNATAQLCVKVGSNSATLVESFTAGTAYICILGIDYGTGKACAYAAPVADYDEHFVWTVNDLDASAITKSAIQTMYLDGYYLTNGGKVVFDEIAAGTKLSDVAVIRGRPFMIIVR